MKKITIGYFYNNKDFGGPVINIRNVTRYLDKDRWQPVVFFSQKTKEIDPIVQEFSESDIPVFFIPHTRPSISNSFFKYLQVLIETPFVVSRMIKMIKRNHIDIIHTNTIGDLQAMIAARMVGVPLVATIREIYTKPRWAILLISWFVYLLANRVICVSNAVQEAMFPFGKDRAKISVVNNGINTDFFDPKLAHPKFRNELGIRSHTKIIGIIGLVDPWKGQHIILESIPKVIVKHPDVVFLFIGGESVRAATVKYRRTLVLRAQELGISDHVMFTGFREDIQNVLASLDIFLHASVSPDPFPTTVLEAMAMQKPVIASKSGGVLEQIEDGKDGILISPGSSEELVRVIDFLLSDPEKAAKMGKEARNSMMRKFTWKHSIDLLSSIYVDLYSSHNR